MYTIKAFVDGKEYMLHNPRVKNLMVGNPYFEVGDNVNGQAEFSVYPTHPFYKYVKKLTTDVIFYKDGVEVFAGRVLYDDEELNGTKKVFVEGELAYLCDSIQRQAVYHNISVVNYLKALLDNHNSQVEKRKQFALGRVSVTDPNDSLYRYSNYETTRDTLKDKLTSRLGGHFVIRKEAGVRYLDYLSDSDYYTKCSQEIRFGKNLLDFSKNIDASDLVTCLIPLGKKLDESSIEGLEERLTIKSVNGGVDYVSDDNAVATYGKIYATQTWDDVTVPENLLKKAKEYLKKTQYEKMVLEIKAIDLNLTNTDVEEIKVGSMVRCVSAPNGLDAEFPVTKLKIYISDFQKNTITLNSESDNATYTSSNAHTTQSIEETIEKLPTKSEILDEAFRAATEQMNDYNTRGYAIKTKNEFIVADTPGVENATKLWRWGAAGLAHYSQGYDGPIDGIAITMDGEINGKMINANSIQATSLDVGYTKSVTDKIDSAKKSANDYSDRITKEVSNTLNSAINNLDDKILLKVESTKKIIEKRNYVVGGEDETLDTSKFNFSGLGKLSKVEYTNQNMFLVSLDSQGSVKVSQNLGILDAGVYTIAVDALYDSVSKRPSSIQYGFDGNQDTKYLSGYAVGKKITFSKTVRITKANKSIAITVNGNAGNELYISNIRAYREIQELIGDVNSKIDVEVGKINASVSEMYENQVYNYCTNGEFSDTDGALAGWGVSGTVEATTYNKRRCCKLSGTGSIYWKQEIRKVQKFTVRFDACCEQGNSGAQIKVIIAGHAFYTSESITENWKSFEFEAEVNPTLFYTYFCNNNTKAVAYVSNVEILGYSSYYAESGLTLLTNSITAEVKRAKGVEGDLSSKITQTANSITAEVKRAKGVEGDLGSKITQTADSISTKLTKYSTTSEMNAAIKAKADGIESTVSKKVGNDEIISKINQSAENISINSSKISLNGAVTANSNFKINKDGSAETKALKITGGSLTIGSNCEITNKGDVFALSPKFYSGLYLNSDFKTGTLSKLNYSMLMGYVGKYIYVGESGGTLWGYGFTANNNIYAYGTIGCLGKKSRIIHTEDGRNIEMYAYETASPTFGDMGTGKLDENGQCYVYLDDDFLLTVEKDMKYHVMLTAKGAGELYVESTNEKDGYFVVKGTPKLEFYWEVKTRQKGCRDTRIEQSDIPEKEDITAEEQEMFNEQMRNQMLLLNEMEKDEIEVQEEQKNIIERMEELE